METRHSTLMAAALLCAAISGGLPVNANQQPAVPSVASAPDVTTLGPQVGEKVPDFNHFKPLNERVPVFQRPFRLVQDVMLDASRAGAAALQGKATLTITGTLTYQACDDKICFNPQSVPLTWTLDVKSLDRERAKRE